MHIHTQLWLNRAIHKRLHLARRLHRVHRCLHTRAARHMVHATPQPKDQVQRALSPQVVVGTQVLLVQLMSGEDEALLVRGDALPALHHHFERVH